MMHAGILKTRVTTGNATGPDMVLGINNIVYWQYREAYKTCIIMIDNGVNLRVLPTGQIMLKSPR